MAEPNRMSDSTLATTRPEFVPSDADLKDAVARLELAYQDYTSHVSPNSMAISLEHAAYLLFVTSKITVRSAVDFGSGFTSYVLRLVCDDVWSVDDAPEWLAWTRRFLERYGRDCGHLVLWDDYRERCPELKHDVVCYDFSSGDIRDNHFGFAVGQIAPGGIGIMDDAQHQKHQSSMHFAARKHGYDLYGLQDWTRDQYRRFAALIVA